MAKFREVVTIKGEPGYVNVKVRGLAAQFVTRAVDQQLIVKKMPRPRGDKLPPITQQQVVTWDGAQEMIKYLDPGEQILARELSPGTAFFPRDYMIQSLYGKTTSWPGHGAYPKGPMHPPRTYKGVKRGRSWPSRVGRPQPINGLRHFAKVETPSLVGADAKLLNPAGHPQMFVFCCEEQNFDFPKMRAGQVVKHGKNKWLHCDPTVVDPVLVGDIFQFRFDPATHADCPECKMLIGEIGDLDGNLAWQSMLRPCPKPKPVTGTEVGHFASGGGVPLPPFLRTHWNALSIGARTFTGDAIGSEFGPSIRAGFFYKLTLTGVLVMTDLFGIPFAGTWQIGVGDVTHDVELAAGTSVAFSGPGSYPISVSVEGRNTSASLINLALLERQEHTGVFGFDSGIRFSLSTYESLDYSPF